MAYGCVWLHSHLNIVVSSSCIFVNLLVWTHAPFMHSAKHPKVGREGNFCSHPVHPSYTLPNTIRASYGSCFMEYCSTVLSVRCGPSSVNIDLTVHSRPDSRKSGTMLHIGVVDMRTTQQQDCVVLTYEPLHMPSSRSTVYVQVSAVFRTPPS